MSMSKTRIPFPMSGRYRFLLCFPQKIDELSTSERCACAGWGVLLRLNEITLGASHCSATVRGSQQEIGKLKEAVNDLMKLNQNSVNNAYEE